MVDGVTVRRRLGRLGDLKLLLDGSHGGIYSMAAVLISCPATDALVPTGMNVSSLDELKPTNLLLDCPDCGRDHEWTPREAVLSAYATEQPTPAVS
jgi:hypothetical protein